MKIMPKLFADLGKAEEDYTEGIITDDETVLVMASLLDSTRDKLVTHYILRIKQAEESLKHLGTTGG